MLSIGSMSAQSFFKRLGKAVKSQVEYSVADHIMSAVDGLLNGSSNRGYGNMAIYGDGRISYNGRYSRYNCQNTRFNNYDVRYAGNGMYDVYNGRTFKGSYALDPLDLSELNPDVRIVSITPAFSVDDMGWYVRTSRAKYLVKGDTWYEQ